MSVSRKLLTLISTRHMTIYIAVDQEVLSSLSSGEDEIFQDHL